MRLAYIKDGDLAVANPDGSGEQLLTSGIAKDGFPSWSPDGTQIAFARSNPDGTTVPEPGVYVIDAEGGAPTLLAAGAGPPVWSPDGARIAFLGGGPTEDHGNEIWLMNADGTGRVDITNDTSGHESEPDWSPDGSLLVYRKIQWGSPEGCCTTVSDHRLEVIKPDGTGQTVLHNQPSAQDQSPAWSPDGTKVVFATYYGPAGILDLASGMVTQIEQPGYDPNWQPIPINAYPRPKGATPIQVSMVPAYSQCASPNRTHGPPLAFPSCASPGQTSDELTVGTADSNGKPTKSRGLVRYDAFPGVPATPADEADVQITVELSDVYRQGTLADYTGELRSRTALRITDKLNTPHPGGPGAATVSDASLSATVPCVATADSTEGASCNLLTTFDALVPGTVTESRRSVWALGPAQLDDGGADNDADTPGDNTPFMTQGLFIP